MMLNPFQPILDICKVVEYVATDQEQEGHEKGIKAAANIYKPILKKLQERQKKIINATDKEQIDFEAQAKLLKKQCAGYEKKTAELAIKIKNQSAKKSSGIDSFFATVNSYGMFSGVNSVRGIDSVMYDSWSLSDYLEKKMNEKREKFYKIEFEKKSLEWQEKIKSVREKIVESIKNLKNLKSTNRSQIANISGIVDDALNEYCETLAKYNALKEME